MPNHYATRQYLTQLYRNKSVSKTDLALGVDKQQVSNAAFVSTAEYILSWRRWTFTHQEITVVKQQLFALDAGTSEKNISVSPNVAIQRS